MRFPKDSKWNNNSPIIQADTVFTNDGKTGSIIAKSNMGQGTEG